MRSDTGYVEFPGSRIYYEVDGQGPGLTFIHACVAHLRMWDEQVARFKDRYTVVRFDLRGFGKSTTDTDVPYSNRDDLRRVLDHVGIQETHLVGNSCGGSAAIDFTLENHGRVGRSPSLPRGWGASRHPTTRAQPSLKGTWNVSTRRSSTRRWSSSRPRSGLTDPVSQPRELTRSYGATWSSGTLTTIAPSRRTTTTSGLIHLRQRGCPRSKCPRWSHGACSTSATSLSRASTLPPQIKGARTKIYPDVAHMVSLERPEEFDRVLGDFIAEVDATAP